MPTSVCFTGPETSVSVAGMWITYLGDVEQFWIHTNVIASGIWFVSLKGCCFPWRFCSVFLCATMLHGPKQVMGSCPGVSHSLWGNVVSHSASHGCWHRIMCETSYFKVFGGAAVSHHRHHLSCKVCLCSWFCFCRIYVTSQMKTCSKTVR